MIHASTLMEPLHGSSLSYFVMNLIILAA